MRDQPRLIFHQFSYSMQLNVKVRDIEECICTYILIHGTHRYDEDWKTGKSWGAFLN